MSLSMPATTNPFWARNRTASEPTRPADPVTIATDIGPSLVPQCHIAPTRWAGQSGSDPLELGKVIARRLDQCKQGSQCLTPCLRSQMLTSKTNHQFDMAA